MKPAIDFDFGEPIHPQHPGRLAAACAAGLTLALGLTVAAEVQRPLQRTVARPRPRQVAVVPVPPTPGTANLIDPEMIRAAPAGIDDQMVHAAPAGIDEAMILDAVHRPPAVASPVQPSFRQGREVEQPEHHQTHARMR